MIWKIVNMQRDLPDGFVITVHWTATEQDGNFTASNYGATSFTPNVESDDYIPYESLTEEMVIGWVQAQMGEETVAAMEANLKANIDTQKNPPTASGLPWA